MISPVTETPSKEKWFYVRDGKKFGPTDLGGLRRMARCRHLLPDGLAWNEGLSDWIPASAIQGLAFPSAKQADLQTDGAADGLVGESVSLTTEADHPYPSLYRSREGRLLLGLCAGLSHKWSISVWAIRLAVILLMPLMMGWAYFLGVFLPILSTRPSPEAAPPSSPDRPSPPSQTPQAKSSDMRSVRPLGRLSA